MAAKSVASDVEQEVEKVAGEVKADAEKEAAVVEADADNVEADVKKDAGPVTEEVYQDALVAEDQAKKALVVLRSKFGIGQVHLEEDLAKAKAEYEKAVAELRALEKRLFHQTGQNPFRPGSLNDGNP